MCEASLFGDNKEKSMREASLFCDSEEIHARSLSVLRQQGKISA